MIDKVKRWLRRQYFRYIEPVLVWFAFKVVAPILDAVWRVVRPVLVVMWRLLPAPVQRFLQKVFGFGLGIVVVVGIGLPLIAEMDNVIEEVVEEDEERDAS